MFMRREMVPFTMWSSLAENTPTFGWWKARLSFSLLELDRGGERGGEREGGSKAELIIIIH